jgi:uric acid-xanthine permease
MDEDQGPAQIVPTKGRGFGAKVSDAGRTVKHTLFTRDGLLGDYDYGFLFRPNLPFM